MKLTQHTLQLVTLVVLIAMTQLCNGSTLRRRLGTEPSRLAAKGGQNNDGIAAGAKAKCGMFNRRHNKTNKKKQGRVKIGKGSHGNTVKQFNYNVWTEPRDDKFSPDEIRAMQETIASDPHCEAHPNRRTHKTPTEDNMWCARCLDKGVLTRWIVPDVYTEYDSSFDSSEEEKNDGRKRARPIKFRTEKKPLPICYANNSTCSKPKRNRRAGICRTCGMPWYRVKRDLYQPPRREHTPPVEIEESIGTTPPSSPKEPKKEPKKEHSVTATSTTISTVTPSQHGFWLSFGEAMHELVSFVDGWMTLGTVTSGVFITGVGYLVKVGAETVIEEGLYRRRLITERLCDNEPSSPTSYTKKTREFRHLPTAELC